jgi:ribosome-associated protein
MPAPKRTGKIPVVPVTKARKSGAGGTAKRAGAVDGETGETHQRFASVSQTAPAQVKAFALEAARLLADNKCQDIVLLDVTSLSQVSDFLVVANGSSDRQMRSTADEVAEIAAKHGYTTFRKDVDDRSTWIVVDFVDVVVHIFEPNTRAHYDLEMLWQDAPRVEWERADQKNRNRAGLE